MPHHYFPEHSKLTTCVMVYICMVISVLMSLGWEKQYKVYGRVSKARGGKLELGVEIGDG